MRAAVSNESDPRMFGKVIAPGAAGLTAGGRALMIPGVWFSSLRSCVEALSWNTWALMTSCDAGVLLNVVLAEVAVRVADRPITCSDSNEVGCRRTSMSNVAPAVVATSFCEVRKPPWLTLTVYTPGGTDCWNDPSDAEVVAYRCPPPSMETAAPESGMPRESLTWPVIVL